jgi:RNA polymerase sigma-70 factor (ECF subfamily)
MDSSTTIRFPSLAVLETDTHAPDSVVPPAAGEPTDEALMIQIGEQGGEALALLFRRYSRLVRGVAFRILRDAAEADDLLQEMFLFVYRKASIFDPTKASFRSWIVQMTYQRAIDQRRYLSSRHFYTHLDLEGTEELADNQKGREEETVYSGLVGSATMQALLRSLTEDQRDTLTLHLFEGYNFEEIALKLGQSFGNIRHHYYRGLERLREQMFPRKLSGRNSCGRK